MTSLSEPRKKARSKPIPSDDGGSRIGKRIRAVRQTNGKTLDAFAVALGYSRRACINWEQNKALPPIGVLPKLRHLFNIDPEWVVMGQGMTPKCQSGPIDWKRYDRLKSDIDEVCRDVAADLPRANRIALTRALYANGDDTTVADRKQIGAIIVALAQTHRRETVKHDHSIARLAPLQG